MPMIFILVWILFYIFEYYTVNIVFQNESTNGNALEFENENVKFDLFDGSIDFNDGSACCTLLQSTQYLTVFDFTEFNVDNNEKNIENKITSGITNGMQYFHCFKIFC